MTDGTGIPIDIFGNAPPPVEEEKPKSIGDKIREEQTKQARKERGKPVLQQWYKEALDKREYTDRASLASAYNATQAKLENSRTLVPYAGLDRHFYETKLLQQGQTSIRFDSGFYQKKQAELIDTSPVQFSAYSDTVQNNIISAAVDEAMGDWSYKKPPIDEVTGRQKSWTGEVLPPRAKGWSEDGLTPRYGENSMSALNRYFDVMETQKDRRDAWEKERTDEGESTSYFAWLNSPALKQMKEEAGNPVFSALIAPIALPANFVKRLIGTGTIFTQLVADHGDPVSWQKAKTQEEIAADVAKYHEPTEIGFANVPNLVLVEKMIEAGFEPPENKRSVDRYWIKDIVSRINPTTWRNNLTIAAAKIVRGDFTISEYFKLAKDARELSRIAYSFSYHDTKDIQEFTERIKDGEHPALVAEDMKQPWSEALGEALLDPLWVVDALFKPVRVASELEKMRLLVSTPIDELARGTVDDIIDAIPGVIAGRTSGRDKTAMAFGLTKRTASAKKGQVLKYATGFIDNLLLNVKNADETADVIRNIVMLTDPDRNIRKAAFGILSDPTLIKNPNMLLTGPAMDFSVLMREILTDVDGVVDPTFFVNGIRKVQAEGGDILKYVIAKAEKSTDNIFPSVRNIIDAENARKLDPEATISEAVEKFFNSGNKLSWIDRAVAYGTGDNWLGKLIKLQKNVSYSIFIGLNPRMAARGYATDTVVIVADAGPSVLAHSADEWAEIGTRWLGSEHPGMSQAFSKAEITGLDAWATELSKGRFENIRDLLTGFFKGDTKGMNLARATTEQLTDIGGKLLRAAEIANSKKIIGISVDKAMRTLIKDAMPDVDGMIASGIPEDVAKNISQLIINEAGDVDAARKILFAALSEGGEPIKVIDLMTWIDQPTKDALQRFELLGRVEAMATEANTLDELIENITRLFDEEMRLGDSAATNFPRPDIHSQTPETDIGHGLEGIAQAASPDSAHISIDDYNEVAGKAQANTNVVYSTERAWKWTQGVIEQTLDNMVSRVARENPANLDAVLEMRTTIKEFFENSPGLLDSWAPTVDKAHGMTTDAWRYGKELGIVSDVNTATLIDEIWTKLEVPGIKPVDKQVAKNKMWDYVKDKVPQMYTESRLGIQNFFNEGMTAVYGFLDNAVGYNAAITESIKNSAIVKSVAENIYVARALDNAVMVEGVMIPVGSVVRGHASMGKTDDAVRAIASWMNPNIGSFRAGSTVWDDDIVTIVNQYVGSAYNSVDEIPLEEAFTAMNQYRARHEYGTINVAFEDIFGRRPDVMVASADVPAWSAIEKHTLVGRITSTDRRHLETWLMENGDPVKVRELLIGSSQAEIDKGLIKYAREILDTHIDEAANIFPESKITNEFLGIGEETTTAKLWRGAQQVEPGAVTGTAGFEGVYATWDKNMANEFAMRKAEGAVVTPVYLDIKNPYAVGDIPANSLYTEEGQRLIEMLKAEGYDGLVDLEGRQVVAFSRSQANIGFAPEGFIDQVPPVVPPHDGSTRVTIGRDVHESQEELEAILRTLKAEAKKVWGDTRPVDMTDEAFEALDGWFTEVDSRMVEFKNTAYAYAQEARNFALHDYGDRFGLDSLLSLFRNFHFWPTRTMYKWAQRLPYNPGLINKYLIYRDAMNSYHKDRPDWLRQYWSTNEIFGFEHDNPVYVSLAGILDVYQNVASGAGFVDPDKRTTWWSNAIDQLDTIIPGNMGLIQQFAVALGLKSIGEDEAAAKWAGRSIPITQTVKGLTSIVGINEGRGIDLDPSVFAFSSDNDWNSFITGRSMGPYEEKRVAVAMAQLISKYPDMPEELLEQARAHEGPLWDEAIAMVAKKGAVGDIVSLFTGINARVRSKDDLVVDQFWSEYIYLVSQYDNYDPVSYRKAREELMNRYPFAETMLLARKNTEEREISYGYAVLSRIPPGQTDEVAKAAGFKYDIIAYFYDNKGDITGLPTEDQQKLKIFFAEAGASIAIPDKATKGEFTEASFRYTKMLEEGQKVFGTSIWDKVDAGFNLKGESLNSQDAWYDYLEEHPEVKDVMRWQSEYILQDPILSAYYGSIDRLRNFWKGDMYQKLEEEFGKDIWDIQAQFWIYSDTEQKEQAKAWLKKYPQLEKYWEKKNKYYTPIITQSMADYGEKLPEGQDLRLRQDFDREAASSGTQDIAAYIESPKIKSYTKDEWLTILGQTNMSMAMLAWEMGKKFPSDLKERLESIASGMGMNYEELIISIGQAP